MRFLKIFSRLPPSIPVHVQGNLLPDSTKGRTIDSDTGLVELPLAGLADPGLRGLEQPLAQTSHAPRTLMARQTGAAEPTLAGCTAVSAPT